LGWVGFF
jgi:Rho family, other